MLWKKILHHRLICSFVVFSLFSVLSLFGLSSNVSATSVNCGNYTFSNSETPFNCDISSLDSSVQWFYSGSIVLDFSYSNNPSLQLCNSITTNSNGPFCKYAMNWLAKAEHSSSNSFYFVLSDYYDLNYTSSWTSHFTRFTGLYYTYYSVIDFTISDSIYFSQSGGGTSEPCPDCPPIPENPYDDKLDNITKAIYVCGAVLLVLYFFFCIYKIIIKDGGSR